MTGSGFFLRPGQVVTNLHVIRGAQRCEIKTLDGKGKVFPVAGTIAVDEEGDLALLSVDMPPERARASELASALPDEGETIFVIGNPLKLEGSVSRRNCFGGSRSSKRRQDHSDHGADFPRQQRQSGLQSQGPGGRRGHS